MSRPDHHHREAEELADRALDGDDGEEAYRLRLATVAQVHAILALVEAVDDLAAVLDAGLGGAR